MNKNKQSHTFNTAILNKNQIDVKQDYLCAHSLIQFSIERFVFVVSVASFRFHFIHNTQWFYEYWTVVPLNWVMCRFFSFNKLMMNLKCEKETWTEQTNSNACDVHWLENRDIAINKITTKKLVIDAYKMLMPSLTSKYITKLSFHIECRRRKN